MMIKREDLLDHLRPEPTCTKPPADTTTDTDTVKTIEPTLSKVTVNLADCLACSGCVTSAETVFLSTHSSSIFDTMVKEHEKTVLIISEQSKASILKQYRHFDIESRLRKLYKEKVVVDEEILRVCRQVVLLSVWNEFYPRVITGTGMLLTSECPGWVSFVEKVHSELIPHLSTTTTPQQLAAVLVKQKHPGAMVATVMPCFDKKLEAIRQQSIDCVLTTGEFYNLLGSEDGDTTSDGTTTASNSTKSHLNSGSGGYLKYIMDRLGDQKYTIMCTKSTRDVSEYTAIPTADHTLPIKLAAIYGFNNIQTLVRKVNTHSTLPYHFVEVMACPAGCVNGGGQLPLPSGLSIVQKRAFLVDILAAYDTDINFDAGIQNLYTDLQQGGHLQTHFEPIVGDLKASTFSIKW